MFSKQTALGAAALTATLLASPMAPIAATRPNLIIISTDDQGYADTGLTGSRDIPTPHIDRIGREGVHFRSGYVTAPLCGPSRAALATGIYHNRLGSEGNPGASGPPLNVPRLSELLNKSGYRTGYVGKWHLGHGEKWLPTRNGYDYFFGQPTWGGFFLPPDSRTAELRGDSWIRTIGVLNPNVNLFESGTNNVLRNETTVTVTEYLTDAFSREAVEFVRNTPSDKPFFLHLSYNAPHTPMQATEKYLDRFPHLSDANHRRTYAAMLSAVDDGVGNLLNTLDEKGLTTNTVVVFISDNGGAAYSNEPEELSRLTIRGTPQEVRYREAFGDSDLRWGRHAETAIGGNGADNTPLRFNKGTLWEGGIRIPFFLRWPESVKPGQTVDTPVITLDLVATFLQAAGVPHPGAPHQLDGIDLTSALNTGDWKQVGDRRLFWRYYRNGAVRDGDWKYIRNGAGVEFLYNLATDPGEKSNLATQESERVAILRQAWEEWNSKLPAAPAHWQAQGARRNRSQR